MAIIIQLLARLSSAYVHFHDLAIIPVILASWYFGAFWGIAVAVIQIPVFYAHIQGSSLAASSRELGIILVSYALASGITVYFLSSWVANVEKVKSGERQLDLLYRLARALTETEDIEEFFHRATEVLRTRLDFRYVVLLVYDPENNELEIKSAGGYASERGLVGMRIPMNRGVTGLAATRRETVVVGDVRKEERYLEATPEVRSEIAVPLLRGEELVGVLNVESDDEDAFDEDAVRFLQLLADELTLALERIELVDKLRTQAITDPLTGLYNHRRFKERLKQEVQRARRYAHSVALLMMDVDDFKLINDRFGHVCGDHVLKTIARELRKELREADILCRYGGEEFGVILPETSRVHAVQVAERIRRAIEKCEVRCEDEPLGEGSVTLSIGVAAYPDDAAEWNALLTAADTALYAAKTSGKNRLCC